MEAVGKCIQNGLLLCKLAALTAGAWKQSHKNLPQALADGLQWGLCALLTFAFSLWLSLAEGSALLLALHVQRREGIGLNREHMEPLCCSSVPGFAVVPGVWA